MDFIFLWQRHGSYASHTRDGEKGAGAVQLGFGVLAFRGHSSSHVGELFAHIGCLLRTKMHMGFLLREYRCPLAMWGVSKKGSGVAWPQSKKVPTRRFSAKKEVVWRDLSAIFHHSAKKEGGWRNLSWEKCRLADFRQKRKLCGATSRNSLFLCLPVQSKCSHGRGK